MAGNSPIYVITAFMYAYFCLNIQCQGKTGRYVMSFKYLQGWLTTAGWMSWINSMD